jgi:hypothetical protein
MTSIGARYLGIAFGGRKGNGKSLLAEYLASVRPVRILPSKTPIVEAFELWAGHPYEKARDDQRLIRFSTEIARVENPLIVADWLERNVPLYAAGGYLPVVPDMRFHAENDVLRRIGVFCIKVNASETTRRARTIARDGDLRNYDPLSATEQEIDELTYDAAIDNDREDGGTYAIAQLHAVLASAGLA